MTKKPPLWRIYWLLMKFGKIVRFKVQNTNSRIIIILLWISANFHHSSRIHLIATIVCINQWIINNMLNVDITGFVIFDCIEDVTCDVLIVTFVTLRLFPTKMLVTMTRHFWQQTQNCITKKSDENVAIKVLILGWQNGRIQHFWLNFWRNLCFWGTKNEFFGVKILCSLHITLQRTPPFDG